MRKLTPKELAARRRRHEPAKVYREYLKMFDPLPRMRLDPGHSRLMKASLKSGVDQLADE
jgi:hypothetical protein